MSYQNSKSTKRFTYTVNRNETSHKAGANTVIIATNPSSEFYSAGTSSMTLTVKEARALQSFLNTELLVDSADSVDSDVAV